MAFSSRPYFFSAALLIASAARADASRVVAHSRATSDSTSRTAMTERDPRAGPTDADRAGAQAAASRFDESRAAPAAVNASPRVVVMLAPDPADPDLQKIWSGP